MLRTRSPLNIALSIIGFSFLLFYNGRCYANIGRVYHPYVERLEKELELIVTRSLDDYDHHRNSYKLGYGESINEDLFIELSVLASETAKSDFDIEAYELEGLYQLNEKGSGPIDYGVLVEIERETKANISEIATSLLAETELDQSSITANIGLAYEFGAGIDNEYDRSARLQWRYRLDPAFEPGLEIYLDEYDKAAGPVVMGLQRLAGKQKIKWELGLLFTLEEQTPDALLRAMLEYEF